MSSILERYSGLTSEEKAKVQLLMQTTEKNMFKKKKPEPEHRPSLFKKFSFVVVEESDGQIRLVNPQCDELNILIVEALMRGLIDAMKEYNEEIKEKENKYINQ